MKTPVDLPQQQIDALDELGKQQGRSKASLIREAVADYLDRRRPGGLDEAFGLWCTRADAEDGVDYQRRLRSEWK